MERINRRQAVQAMAAGGVLAALPTEALAQEIPGQAQHILTQYRPNILQPTQPLNLTTEAAAVTRKLYGAYFSFERSAVGDYKAAREKYTLTLHDQMKVYTRMVGWRLHAIANQGQLGQGVVYLADWPNDISAYCFHAREGNTGSIEARAMFRGMGIAIPWEGWIVAEVEFIRG